MVKKADDDGKRHDVSALGPNEHSAPQQALKRRDPMPTFNFLDRYSPYALGILRIVVALIFIAHGTQKLFGFPAPAGFNLPPLFSLFWFGAILEAFGGLAILLGVFTRPVAFILAGEMAYAYWMVHAKQSFFPNLNNGDAAILYCFIFLYLVFAGAGAFSIDNRKNV
jgi:putative oxidoreductase